MPLRPTLAARILGAILACLVIFSLLVINRTEVILEQALLDQAKRQAQTYLLGLELEAASNGSPADPAILQPILERALHGTDQLGFAIHRLYAYDTSGHVYAAAGADENTPLRDLSGHYGRVLREGTAYLGSEVESFTDPKGRQVPKVDIIIPLREGGRVVAGLEVEINLEETSVLIAQLDDGYEQEMVRLVSGAALALLLVVGWLVLRGLIQPIGRIAAATSRIAEGEFTTRVEIKTQDEIGRLAGAVNRMADSLEQLFNDQENAYMQSLRSLAKALEAKDAYTARHSARVANFSVMLGRRLGLSEAQLRMLKQGALMHDLGKIGIPDAILNKAGPLDDAEYEVMRSHPEMTAAIMRPLKRFREFAEIAAWHHERWDGAGYPDGLQGEAIPLLARIVSIADTWDAMTGDRVYRKGMSVERALSILERERDSGQWDPHLLATFIELIHQGQEAREQVEGDMLLAE